MWGSSNNRETTDKYKEEDRGGNIKRNIITAVHCWLSRGTFKQLLHFTCHCLSPVLRERTHQMEGNKCQMMSHVTHGA